MGSSRTKLIVLVAALVAVGLAIGLTLWLTSDDSNESTLSHAGYAQLYNAAVVGKTKIAVLDEWPKPPYQDYHDGSGNRCLEWFDKATAGGLLYDLCFNKSGVLVTKQTP